MDAPVSSAGDPLPSSWRRRGQPGYRDATPGPQRDSPAATQSKECLQSRIQADVRTITTFLAQEYASGDVLEAFQRIRDALLARVSRPTTEQAIQQLQETVQGLVTAVNKACPSQAGLATSTYAEAAKQGARRAPSPHTSPSQKPVPLRHSREIIVERGSETLMQKEQSYKELVEQLNKAGSGRGAVAAVRKLPSGNVLITMEDNQAQTKWLEDQEWLKVLGEGAKVKRREFAIIAHGIWVSQVQNQAQAIAEIHKQNPKFKGIEILRVAFTKKLLQLGRATGPLIISVLEPEQANCIIDASLIWQYKLHNCEPFIGECTITQCFKCYQYGHTGDKCRNAQRCSFCAALGHATNDCLAKEEKTMHRCVPCSGNHPSWARECLIRQKQAAAARRAYKTRLARYQAPTRAHLGRH